MSPILAHHLQGLIFGPSSKWYVENSFLDVDKPCVAHHSCYLATGASVEVNAESQQALVDQAPILCDGMIGTHRVIGRDRVVIDLLRLNPTSRTKMSMSLLEYRAKKKKKKEKKPKLGEAHSRAVRYSLGQSLMAMTVCLV